MAVAVKNTPETAPQRTANVLAVGSLVGTVYVLGSLAVLFYGVPAVWDLLVKALVGSSGSFVDRSLLLVVMVAVAAGLGLVGQRLLGTNPPKGIRAGIFSGALGVIVAFLLAVGIGHILERSLGSDGAAGPWLTAAIGLVLVGAWGWLLFQPSLERWLLTLEEQGWFSAAAYKRSQGQRVRRGTILGILILAATGIWTLINRDTLHAASEGWTVLLPFSDGRTVTLLPHLQFTLPILLAAFAMWVAYRIVNFPPFADFLIATEAELNKVSWTTRRRLIQDTIVVLATMVLMTVFLFTVDVLWVKLMSSSWIRVLQTGQSTSQKQDNSQDW